MPPETHEWPSFAPLVITGFILAFSLFRQRATRSLARALRSLEEKPILALRYLHSGLIGDYIVFMMTGVAAFAVLFSLQH